MIDITQYIGKVAYASKDGVQALIYDYDQQKNIVVDTFNEGERIGVVSSYSGGGKDMIIGFWQLDGNTAYNHDFKVIGLSSIDKDYMVEQGALTLEEQTELQNIKPDERNIFEKFVDTFKALIVFLFVIYLISMFVPVMINKATQ